jgi:hypothetical protein
VRGIGKEPTIFDVLEILQSLSKMESTVDCGFAVRAALITDKSRAAGKPSIFDAMEILQFISGMKSAVVKS